VPDRRRTDGTLTQIESDGDFLEELKVKDRTAIACTVVLAATLALCTWYLSNAIRDAAAEISSDESDDSDNLQQTQLRGHFREGILQPFVAATSNDRVERPRDRCRSPRTGTRSKGAPQASSPTTRS
jgi:hypothetical protein